MKISMEILKSKKVIICGKGKIQRDFEYIFDEIECKYYISDSADGDNNENVYPVENLVDENLDDIIVILCQKDDLVEYKLEKLGLIKGKHYFNVDDLLFLLDPIDVNLINQKKVYIWGCGETQKHLESALKDNEYEFDIVGYVDSNPDKWSDNILSPMEFSKIENTYIIVASIYYDDIKKTLDEFGKKEGIDFDCYTKFMARPSVMMRKTMYDRPLKVAKCQTPFKRMTYTCFGVYPCCVSWVDYPVGNPIVDTCEETWNSIYMKLYRLSMENRTYSFCKKGVCKILPSNPLYAENEIVEYNNVREIESPELLVLGLDDSCNLHCESCRHQVRVAQGKLLNERKKYAKKLIDSKYLELAKEVFLSVDGEVFASEVDRMVLYGDVKRNDIHILSNGNLLDYTQFQKLEQTYKKIWISISIDAATEDTYKVLRRGGNWKKLQQNLAMLSEQKKAGKIECIDIRFVVQRKNYSEMVSFAKMAKDYGFDKAIFSRIKNYGTYSDDEFNKIAMMESSTSICEELEREFENPIFKEDIVDISEFSLYRKRK